MAAKSTKGQKLKSNLSEKEALVAKSPRHKSNFLYYLLFLIALVAYIVLTFQQPQTTNNFDLTKDQVIMLRLSFVAPIALIWFAAFYGALKIKRYSQSIESAPDGYGLNYIADGLIFLVLSLIGNSLIGTFRNLIDQSFLHTFVLVQNYYSIFMSLIGFYLIFRGSQIIKSLLQKASEVPAALYLFVAAVIASYIALLFQNPNRNLPPGPGVTGSYFLADSLIITTIVIPYVLTWLLGTIGAYNIYVYSANVKGAIYKKGLNHLSFGLISIIILSICFQLLNSAGQLLTKLFDPRLNPLALTYVLIFVYVILFLLAVAYLFVALGAKKLSKIEQV